jgi:hypothetical protein
MESIHLKTVDPFSQDLLRNARQKALELNWERYEKLQPQDGFLRLGLSCPYGCMQGPCRIDPFGRGSDRGLCGLGRDGMVAAFFLRLILQGVLESTDGSISEGPGAIQPVGENVLQKLGGSHVSISEVYQAALMLARPAKSVECMVQQSIRLGILATRLLYRENGPAQSVPCKTGYGLLAGNQPIIGVVGNPSQKPIDALSEAISQKHPSSIQLVSLGDWIVTNDQFLPCACTTGEAELAISTCRISLLFTGSNTDPGLIEISQKLHIPIVNAEDTFEISEILQMAQQFHSAHPQMDVAPDSSFVGEGRVMLSTANLKGAFDGTDGAKVSMIGGFDTPQQSMGWIPVEVAKALKGVNHRIATWGDAALWMIKDGLSSPEQSCPALVLDPCQGPLQAIGALREMGQMDTLGGVCFTGLRNCHELAIAVGLAAVGTKVCIAMPLPVWGSKTVRSCLAENLNACGGSLKHFDHPAEASEILDWFTQ